LLEEEEVTNEAESELNEERPSSGS